MEHLTVNEIIDFVSINELNEKSINLAAKVNAHILKCDDCLEKVKAFQLLNDEFSNLRKEEPTESNSMDFENTGL